MYSQLVNRVQSSEAELLAIYSGGTIRICLAKRLVDRWLAVQSPVTEQERYGTSLAGKKCCRDKSLHN